MEKSRESSLEMHTLLLCADVQFLEATGGVLRELKVTLRIVGDSEAALAAIQEYEFDAIVVDWREISNLEDFLKAVRRSKLNRECVVVAIVYDLLDLRQAFAAGVQLLIHKPASVVQIERCFRAAYCACVVRRRKRHREPVNIVASSSTRRQPFTEMTIANLSEGGARARLACDSGAVVAKLSVGAEVDLRFALPETQDMFQCTGKVVWTRPEGDAGIRFSYIPDRERLALEQWLTGCVERSRAEICERLRADCA